jgi:hypothetical protein
MGRRCIFLYKDSWWERRWYGLVLVRHGHPLITHLPSWFRWKRKMTLLSRINEFFRASATSNAVKTLRRAIGGSNKATS